MKKLLQQFSSLLLRGHLYLNRRLTAQSKVRPRMLHYRPVAGNPKVFHFNGNFVIGGTSQLIADLAERTSGRYTHHIIVPEHPRPLPYQPMNITEYPLIRMPALYEFLEKERPALAHIHYWIRPMHRYYDFGLWYDAVFKICGELGIKVIQNINVPTRPFHSPAVAHNVFVSRHVLDEFNDSDVPSSVIYPGSDFTHFINPDDHVLPLNAIGMVYRLDADKLNAEAIEVFIAAVKKKPGLLCYIIGGGFYLDHYKKRVKEEGLSGQFIFTGFVSYDSLRGYYKKIGLIIAPVHDESFGQVTPFAMGAGLPVAGYDTGALAEILGTRRSLVHYGDIDALSDLIVAMLNDPQRMKQEGLENRQRAREYFTVEKMISAYEHLYQLHIA